MFGHKPVKSMSVTPEGGKESGKLEVLKLTVVNMAQSQKEREETNDNSKETMARETQPTTFMGKLKKGLKKLNKIIFSTVGLVVLLVGYSIIGAFIFQAIEGGNEATEKQSISELREDIIGNLKNTSINPQTNPEKWESLVNDLLQQYESELQAAFARGINTESTTEVWDFWGSFFYCATIYTTIGYGNIAPVTPTGQIVTILYSIIGIPLCLILLADLGKLFTRGLKFIWSYVRRFWYTGHCTKEGAAAGDNTFVVDDEFNLPPLVAIFIAVIYILLGALLYCQWESWSYLEAFYFVFISLSTIGFGDVLPEHPKYFLATSFYILLGLSLVAMVINVVMEAVQNRIETTAVKITQATKNMGLDIIELEEEGETADRKREPSPKKER